MNDERVLTPATHEEWVELRQKHITATDVASAVTTKTVANWRRLKKEKIEGATFQGNKATEWGHAREPELFGYASTFLNPDLVLNDDPQMIVTRGARFSCSPDAYTKNVSTGAEFKTTNKPIKENRSYQRYLVQVQFTMWVTGAKQWYLVSEQHDNFVPVEITDELITADEPKQAGVVAVANELYEFVFNDVEPDWFGGAASDELTTLVTELGELEDQKRNLDQAISEHKALIGDLVGDSASEEIDGWKLTVSTRKPSLRFDSSAFKKDHEGLYKKYMNKQVKGSKTVTVKKIKEK